MDNESERKAYKCKHMIGRCCNIHKTTCEYYNHKEKCCGRE